MSGSTSFAVGDRALGDVRLDGAVRLGRLDEVDLRRVLVGGPVGQAAGDVPVDAAIEVEHVAAAGPDHQADELAGVGLVLGEHRPGPHVRELLALDVMALLARVGGQGQLHVIGRRDRRGVRPQHDLDELAGAGDLRLDPAGDPGRHVALAAGDVSVRAGLVRLQLGGHRVTAAAEVRGLRPVDQRDRGEDRHHADAAGDQQDRCEARSRPGEPEPPPTEVEERDPPPAPSCRCGRSAASLSAPASASAAMASPAPTGSPSWAPGRRRSARGQASRVSPRAPRRRGPCRPWTARRSGSARSARPRR